jgi:hypothetical protein
MRFGAGSAALLFMLFLTATVASAADLPDLKGSWVVKASGVGIEKPGDTPPPVLHSEKLGFHEVEFLLVIDRQEGFRFSGYRESKRKKEIVAGVIGYDHKSLYMVDTDGTIQGKLVSPDQIEAVYLHIDKRQSLASREIMTRKR